MIRGARLLQNRWICGAVGLSASGVEVRYPKMKKPLFSGSQRMSVIRVTRRRRRGEPGSGPQSCWVGSKDSWGGSRSDIFEDEGRWETHQRVNAAYMVHCIGNQEAPDEEYWWCRLCDKGADTSNCHCYCDGHLNKVLKMPAEKWWKECPMPLMDAPPLPPPRTA